VPVSPRDGADPRVESVALRGLCTVAGVAQVVVVRHGMHEFDVFFGLWADMAAVACDLGVCD
jgi:hypothetical protein